MAQATAKQSTAINVRVDEDVKRDLDFILDKLGLNVSVVVNMLFRQMIMDEALPFQPKYKRKRLTTEERLKSYTGNYNRRMGHRRTRWQRGVLVAYILKQGDIVSGYSEMDKR